MPELPDLEVYCRNLKPRVCGQEITSVTFHREKRLNVTPEVLANALKGSKLDQVQRDGKEVWFTFSNGRVLSVHLMLKGQFAVVPDDSEVKYKVLTLGLGQEGCLVVFDSLGWTTLTLDPQPSSVPDAISEAVTFDYLKRRLKGSGSTNMKLFLTEQDSLRGIGNAYSDEILWHCRIAPESRCDRLPDEAIRALAASLRSVLTDAVEQIEALKPGIMGGEVRDHLKVYNKKLCPNGLTIQCKDLGQRKTYFTSEQKRY
jgi:formamidopyrimidine-DNA glycosylase